MNQQFVYGLMNQFQANKSPENAKALVDELHLQGGMVIYKDTIYSIGADGNLVTTPQSVPAPPPAPAPQPAPVPTPQPTPTPAPAPAAPATPETVHKTVPATPTPAPAVKPT